jgi:hypothetical protein
MQTKEIEAYFKTENEHWNTYAFKTVRKALEKQVFTDYNKLMQLYELSIKIASESHREKPFEGLQLIVAEYDKSELTTAQKLHLLEGVHEYLFRTDFDGWSATEIEHLIQSQISIFKDKLKNTPPEYNKPLTGSLRDSLKEIMQKELQQMPKNLEKLEPEKRLEILCKLMPYVLPKTESIQHTFGEPQQPKKNWLE